MGPIAAWARAMANQSETKAEEKPIHAGMESKIRQAVAYLDEKRAFYWTPGGFITAVLSEDADYFERSPRERGAEDHWSDIDKRLALAYYETQTFADYIGAD